MLYTSILSDVIFWDIRTAVLRVSSNAIHISWLGFKCHLRIYQMVAKPMKTNHEPCASSQKQDIAYKNRWETNNLTAVKHGLHFEQHPSLKHSISFCIHGFQNHWRYFVNRWPGLVDTTFFFNINQLLNRSLSAVHGNPWIGPCCPYLNRILSIRKANVLI